MKRSVHCAVGNRVVRRGQTAARRRGGTLGSGELVRLRSLCLCLAVLLTAPMVVAQNGPLITFAGLIRDDGCPDCCCQFSCQNDPCAPPEFDPQGRQIFRTTGRGKLVFEARPGASGRQPSSQGSLIQLPDGSVTEALITDPSGRPSVRVGFGDELGDGNPPAALVDCDNIANIPPGQQQGGDPPGGVPAISSTFPPGDATTAALVDIACRFEFFTSGGNGCTKGDSGEFAFANPASTRQYCLDVPQSAAFPFGDTVATIQVCDNNPAGCELGPPVEIVLRRGTGGGGNECVIDVDGSGAPASVATDVVYIARHLLGFNDVVPPSFRALDPTIPDDAVIASNIDNAGSMLDVDESENVSVATDVVYIARRLLGFNDVVPPSFRALDPTILSDTVIGANIDALCP